MVSFKGRKGKKKILLSHKPAASRLESLRNGVKHINRAPYKAASIWLLLEKQEFTLDGRVFPPTSQKSYVSEIPIHFHSAQFSVGYVRSLKSDNVCTPIDICNIYF